MRLTGVNAPESGECHHLAATAYLRDSIEGREVTYVVLAEDQFGRSLAHVWREGQHVNLELVARGHAIATTPDDDDSYGTSILDAEAAAATGDVGIWADDACGSSDPLRRIEIEQVRPDPPGRDEEDMAAEQVILTSRDEAEVDLSGWVIRDESSRHRYHFPAGTALGPGDSITVRSADPGWRPGGTPVWNNQGDLVLVLDRTGRIVDHLRC